MTGEEVRIHTWERSAEVARLSLVSPGKRWHAFAATGPINDIKIEAAGYGTTEDEALADLERNVLAPKPEPVAPKKPRLRINHLAQAADPMAPFQSTCVVEGCGRQVIRVYGVQARRSNFRHVKPTKQ